jgi:hypothetical protein
MLRCVVAIGLVARLVLPTTRTTSIQKALPDNGCADPSDNVKQTRPSRYSSVWHKKLKKLKKAGRPLSLALKRRFFASPRPLRLPDLLIVSPGGVASTTLIKHISKYKSTNCSNDRDDLKHLPHPPKWLGDVNKVIFVTGNPDKIVRSIKRRGWIRKQGAKLGSIGAAVLPSPLNLRLFERAIRRQMSFWETWCIENKGKSLLMSYDELWNSLNALAAFCEISDASFLDSFPPKRGDKVDLL